MKRIVAIVPARGGSKGIPRKNLERVGGMPLVALAAEQALACRAVTEVVVSTEDEEIAQAAARPGVQVVGRPEEFIHDSTVQEVDRLLVWTVRELEKRGPRIDIVVLLYPTAPLRRVATIDEAVRMVDDGEYDSVLSLYEDATYLWRRTDETVEPVNYDPATRGPRQKEQWNQWAENKAVYATRRDLLVETGCRLGGRMGAVEMTRLESIDVDAPDDLAMVRLLYDARMRREAGRMPGESDGV